MTLLTRLVLLAHVAVAVPYVVSPEWAAEHLSGRPKLNFYAVRYDAERQLAMVYMYERVGYILQMFLGLTGLFMALDNWYFSLALVGFDAASAYVLTEFLAKNPSHAENLDNLALFYMFGAAVGAIGLLRRWFTKGVFLRINENKDHWIVHFLAFLAMFTYIPELGLAFPKSFGLFNMNSPLFVKSLNSEGQILFDLHCERILIGLATMAALCIGSLVTRDLNIYAPHCVAHMALALGFLQVITAKDDRWSGGSFELPTFLHLAVSFSNGLNYVKVYRRKVFEILQGDMQKHQKQE